MTNIPPRKVKVLTRLKITEVSAVDRGAGEGCRVVLSKRDDSDYGNTELSVEERARAKMEGRAALRDAEDIERRKREDGDEDRKRYFDLLTGRTTIAELYSVDKSFDADAAGDEADMRDEETSADEPADIVAPANKQPVSFDTTDGTRMRFPNERKLAEWLAIQSRIRKSSTKDSTMSTNLNLSDVVKAYGITALAKHMVAESTSFGVTEEDLTKLATEDAQRRFPNDRGDVAFAKMFSESVELRQAIEIAKNAPFNADAEAEKDAAAACRELAKIGAERWPSLPRASQFARAAECNPEILKRAHRRPSPVTAFPFPK